MNHTIKTLIALLISLAGFVSSHKATAQLDGLSKFFLGPHVTLGYEWQERSYFNAGLNFNAQAGVDNMFRFKPGVSIGRNSMVNLSVGYWWMSPFIDEVDNPLELFLLFSNIGVEGSYGFAGDDSAFGLQPYISTGLGFFDIEFGYNFFPDESPVFQDGYRVGVFLNINEVWFGRRAEARSVKNLMN